MAYVTPRDGEPPESLVNRFRASVQHAGILRELGREWGTELPKGASRQVERVGREVYRAGGLSALNQVAKTHFKTTLRVTQQEL